MLLKLKYRNFTFPIAGVALAIDVSPIMSDAEVPIAHMNLWKLQGELLSESQAEITAEIRRLEAAFSEQGGDIALLFEDGSPTAHRLRSADATGGVIVSRPSYPKGDQSEYANTRTFEIGVRAEVPVFGNANAIVSYSETITVTGTGGPRFVAKELRNGPPDVQVVSDRTPTSATQTGEAVGYSGWIAAPAPLWPGSEVLPARSVTRSSPKYKGIGRNRTAYNFPTRWNYSFLGTTAFTGRPSNRPGG